MNASGRPQSPSFPSSNAPAAEAAAPERSGARPPHSGLPEQVLAEKRFINDAAHQLRTPLAGIISQAELALQENDPQQLHQRIRKIRAAAQRGAQLVKQMLALARSESATPNHSADETYDLAQLAREVAREWIPRSLALHKDLGYEGADSAWVRGNRFMMREAISNLIDNALSYTAADGHVTVRVQAVAAAQHAAASNTSAAPANQPALDPQTVTAAYARPTDTDKQSASSAHNEHGTDCPCPPGQCTASPAALSVSSALSAAPTQHPSHDPCQAQRSSDNNSNACNDKPCRHTPDLNTVILEVIDNGPGVAPEQLPHVFERFWRADDEHTSGSGLGLPLVERIATQHGGCASAHNAQPHGFIVRLSLPAADERQTDVR
ncbi:MAG: HAMP domain-containing sensor histidine kinase [Brachymonas sp.]|nr:HAMP domain-containing sensor histidine kinase [Brachymonas sp.]